VSAKRSGERAEGVTAENYRLQGASQVAGFKAASHQGSVLSATFGKMERKAEVGFELVDPSNVPGIGVNLCKARGMPWSWRRGS